MFVVPFPGLGGAGGQEEGARSGAEVDRERAISGFRHTLARLPVCWRWQAADEGALSKRFCTLHNNPHS